MGRFRQTLAGFLVLISAASPARSQSKFLKSFAASAAAGVIGPAIPSNSISHLAVDGRTIWIGTGRGVARSTDHGMTWESFASVPQFANPGIFALAPHGDTVWVSTGFNKDVDGQSVQTGSGYTYTLDNARTWSSLPQALDGQGDSLVTYGVNTIRFLPVIVPEQNVTFDIALSDSAIWITSWASGLRKSTDLGHTWQRIVLPSSALSSISPTDTLGYYLVDPRLDNNFLAFSVCVENDSTIWEGSAGGINKSTDGGASWMRFSKQNQVAHILGDWVIAIKPQHLSSVTRIWTTNWPASDTTETYGVSYTEDGGRTWTNVLQGSKAYDFAFNGTIAYVASDDGLYRTADGGRTWVQSGPIVDQKSGQRLSSTTFFSVGTVGDTVYAGTDEGLVRTIDSPSRPFGQEWDVLRSYVPLPDASSAYAYPNPFSPRLEVARIHYRTGAAGAVTIEIFDFGMNRVRTVVKDAQRGANADHDELWDGKDDAGVMIPNGVYFYRVVLNGGNPVWGKVMVLQ